MDFLILTRLLAGTLNKREKDGLASSLAIEITSLRQGHQQPARNYGKAFAQEINTSIKNRGLYDEILLSLNKIFKLKVGIQESEPNKNVTASVGALLAKDLTELALTDIPDDDLDSDVALVSEEDDEIDDDEIDDDEEPWRMIYPEDKTGWLPRLKGWKSRSPQDPNADGEIDAVFTQGSPLQPKDLREKARQALYTIPEVSVPHLFSILENANANDNQVEMLKIIELLSSFKDLDYDKSQIETLSNILEETSDNIETQIEILKLLSKTPKKDKLSLIPQLKRILVINLTNPNPALSYYSASILSDAAPNSFNKKDIEQLIESWTAYNPTLITAVLINIGKKNLPLRNQIITELKSKINPNSTSETDLRNYRLIREAFDIDQKEGMPIYNISRTVGYLAQKAGRLSRPVQYQSTDIGVVNINNLLQKVGDKNSFLDLLYHSYDSEFIRGIEKFIDNGKSHDFTKQALIDILFFVASPKAALVEDCIANQNKAMTETSKHCDDSYWVNESYSPMSHDEHFSPTDLVSYKLLLGEASPELINQSAEALKKIVSSGSSVAKHAAERLSQIRNSYQSTKI